MTDYFYDMDLVVDPLNPSNVVANGLVSIYDPADTAGTTLLALKDPSGLPLPNPVLSNANGFLPPRIAQVPQTMWKSGGFTGYFNSYKGLRDEAVGAKTAAQTAANSAASAANEVVTTAAVDGSGNLKLTKANGTVVDAGPVKGATGAQGPKGDKGLDGSNVLPTDDAIEQAILTAGTKTKAALSATYVPKWKPNTAYLAGDAVLSPAGDTVTAKVNFTSGASYSAANWNAAPAVAAKLDSTAAPALIASEGAKSFAPLGVGSAARFARQNPFVGKSFQTGHGWTVVSGAVSSDLNDVTDFFAGSQSIRVTTDTAGNSAIIGGTGPTIPVGKFFRLWVKVTDPETCSRIRIFASTDSGFANYYTFNTYFSGAAPGETQRKWKAGEWVPIDFPWSDVTTTGTPDRANLTYLRVLINGRGGGVGATVRVGRLDYIDTPNPFPQGVVCLTYDDSFASHYTLARTHLSPYGYAGTLFPIIERIDQPGYLTLAQVTELQKLYGWEIGGHASTYAKHVQSLDGMNHAERIAELGTIRAWQQSNGFSSPSYAYPNGTFTKDGETDLALYYSLGRMASGRTSILTPDELPISPLPYRLLSANGGSMTLANLKLEVDRCKANGTWLNIMYHDILTTKVGTNDVSTADHKALVDYLNTQGMAVRTMQEVLRASAA